MDRLKFTFGENLSEKAGPELKQTLCYIGVFLLLQCQISHIMSPCVHDIGMKIDNVQMAQKTDLKNCFVENPFKLSAPKI